MPSFSASGLSVPQGGTGDTTLTAHAVLVGEGTSPVATVGPGSAGQVLQSGGALADPAYSTATYPSTTTANQLLYSSATNTVSGLATANNAVLVTNGSGVPSFSVSGLGVAQGGTGDTTLTAHAVLVGEGTSPVAQIGPGATGQILMGNTGADPSFSTASYPSTTSINQILYSSAANTVTGLATANNAILVTNGSGVPSFSASGLSVPQGGTGDTTLTAHAVLVGEGTSPVATVGPGSAGQILQSGGALADPAYSTATYPSTTTANQLLYSSATNTVSGLATANNAILITNGSGVPSFSASGLSVPLGGTGDTTLTAHAVLVGEGTSPVAQVGPGSTGQVLMGVTGADPIFSTAAYPSTTTVNQLLYSSSANTVTGLATANNAILVTNGSGVPSFSASGLTVPQGGTGNTTLTAHAVLVGEGTSAVAQVGPGTANQVLMSGGAGADPAYSTATYPPTTTANQLLYSSATNTIGGLTSANTAILITNGSGVPSFSTAPLGFAYGGTNVTSVTTTPTATSFAGWDANENLSANSFISGFTSTATAGGNTTLTVASTQLQFFTGATTQTVTLPSTGIVAGQQFMIVNNSTGVVTVQSSGANTIQAMAAGTTLTVTALIATPTTAANWNANYANSSVSYPLSVANGGTGATTFTAHSILVGEGTSAVAAVGPGSAGQILQSGGAGADPAYSTATYPATTTINQILYSSAANTVTGIATATSSILATNGSGVPSLVGPLGNGQILIGSNGATPVATSLTAGSGITITPGAGSITISSSSAGIPWNNTSASGALASNNGYFVTSGTISLSLPATSSVGDAIRIVLRGGTSWSITQAIGQQVFFGSTQTTSGAGGSITSTAAGDAIEIVCTVANAEWTMLSSVGNLTIV